MGLSSTRLWSVYIVECADGSLYTGCSNDLTKRLLQHNTGQGAKYTHHRGPVMLRYTETVSNRSEALKREIAIKKLSRKQKLQLILTQSAELE